ncbi:hypothetical protein J5I95_11645 [Candidatus Poribacteria bacterium]|nr:hypothetical protein [Candidatus Poribacteria bacterium]
MKSQELPTIGFIGLGNMGGRMAKNLHNAQYPLIGYDIDAAKCTALAATGATAGQDTAEVVRNYEFCKNGNYEMFDNMNRPSRSFWRTLTEDSDTA